MTIRCRKWQSSGLPCSIYNKVRGIEHIYQFSEYSRLPQFAKAYHVNEYSDQSDC